MQRIASTALVLGTMALAAFYAWPSSQPPGALPDPADTPPTVAPAPAQPRPAIAFFSELAASDAAPTAEIMLTERQELIVNNALREVFNFYLLEHANTGGSEALARYLQRRLPDNASQEAMLIATQYQRYIAQHDRILAAQNFNGQMDAYRLEAWFKQRDRLRRDVLGERVTQAWFQLEDADLMQVIDELRRAPAAAATPTLAGSGALPPAGSESARHRQHMLQVLAAATQGYTAGPAMATANKAAPAAPPS